MKRNFMARFGLILLVACFIVSSVGFAAPKPVTLKFANWGATEKATEGVFKKMVADFEAANKNIKVELVNLPYGDIKQQVLVMLSGGETLDVVQAERAMVNSYLGSGYLAEMNRLFSSKYLNDFYPNVLDDLRQKGKLYGIPWIISPWVLVYNKDLFAKAGLDPNAPPKTYDELLAAAAKLSKLKDKDGNPIYGAGEATGLVPISGSCISRLMYSFGGGIWDKKGKVNLNNKGNIEAFKYLKTLYENQYTPDNAKLKDLRNLMAIGRLGMYFDQAWGTGGIFGINPAMKAQIGIAPAPASAFGKAASPLNAHVLCVLKDSKHKKEAAKFIEFITDEDTMINLYKNTPFFAARKSVDDSSKLHDSLLKPAKSSIGQIVPVTRQHLNMEDAYLEIIKAAQRVTVGKEAPATVVKDLDAKLKEVLK
ncbi:multiple sugar transport system substrate-binding protein [Hydrogenispora ethanolica]|uniref:Multiple sugar transport system substrate-binding protein n=1 Tax=Hydrogenispora ethanolica TaxID=1082276 RepID=A0A4R1QWK0_HYDET|nr:sugar ABC transporter substrate-binding protein [Hydrogenispora ethanolica]TCL57863.1 multiple sugar transport system substrate-binding protein [Hydrogenispora ethanolica]